MERARGIVNRGNIHVRDKIDKSENLDFYEGEGFFKDERTIEVNGEQLTADHVFIACGTRPITPAIPGLDSTEFFNNETLLGLDHPPKSLIVIGGGYIAVELAHFFSAMGSKVIILEAGDCLVAGEEREISALLEHKLLERMQVLTGIKIIEMKKTGVGCEARILKDGHEIKLTAEKVLVAAGRRSNADLIKAGDDAIDLDAKGFIAVNQYLETTLENIFAIGDINGKQMFRHTANREAEIAWHNAVHGPKIEIDYTAVPHAVFTSPQIASVGLTEEQAAKSHDIEVKTARYDDVTMGMAMVETDGFAKAIFDKKTSDILGLHIIGPHASMLIQEAVNAMATREGIYAIAKGVHIHPALTELIREVLL